MSFITSVPGPSRIPYTARAIAVRCNSTAAAASPAAAAAAAAGPPEQDARAAVLRAKLEWATAEGYKKWKESAATQYRTVGRGQRAQWLGGSVPYATNPSFRPPPPVSNDVQDVIYRELCKGKRTIGQISEQHNVSKARIEAIRKLKAVEDEFKRQNIQLQEAFLNGMEPLLGIPRRKGSDTRLIEDEQTNRHASIGVEQEEERRLEQGIGAGGVFADRAKQVGREGIERTVWEFREEGQQDEPVAAAEAETVEAKSAPAVKTDRARRIGKSVYRFVDKTQ